ncbi:hypothetical protein BH18THE2_BH18THE2_43540 [soil metagenome]
MEIRKVQLQENGWWLEELRQEKERDIKVETGKTKQYSIKVMNP